MRLNHHLHVIVILKGFEDPIALLLRVHFATGIVAVELPAAGGLAVVAQMLFVAHDLFDRFVQGILVPTDDLETPSGGVVDFGFVLCFIV